MRTVVTYLDKNNKQVNKDEAWTVVTKVYNDAGNLQRTGYSLGEAQKKAAAGQTRGGDFIYQTLCQAFCLPLNR